MIWQFGNARAAVMKQFSRRIDRTNVGDIEHADRYSDDGENRVETLEVAKNLLFDCQFVWIKIDLTLEQGPLSRYARHSLSSIAATLSGADAFESFWQNKRKSTRLF